MGMIVNELRLLFVTIVTWNTPYPSIGIVTPLFNVANSISVL